MFPLPPSPGGRNPNASFNVFFMCFFYLAKTVFFGRFFCLFLFSGTGRSTTHVVPSRTGGFGAWHLLHGLLCGCISHAAHTAGRNGTSPSWSSAPSFSAASSPPRGSPTATSRALCTSSKRPSQRCWAPGSASLNPPSQPTPGRTPLWFEAWLVVLC